MAVDRNRNANQATNASPARTEGGGSNTKKTLGFLNLNIATVGGAPIRVDAIRFMEGNRVHEQLASYLSLSREEDKDLVAKSTPEELAAEKARRVLAVVEKLEFSFNPTRTDEEAKIALF